MKINANRIIDTLCQELYELEELSAKLANVGYIRENSPEEALYYRKSALERKFSFASDLTGISENVLYQLARIARRWYEKTEWQLSLSDETAEKLLDLLISQEPKRHILRREEGNAYLLDVHKGIVGWAKTKMRSNDNG